MCSKIRRVYSLKIDFKPTFKSFKTYYLPRKNLLKIVIFRNSKKMDWKEVKKAISAIEKARGKSPAPEAARRHRAEVTGAPGSQARPRQKEPRPADRGPPGREEKRNAPSWASTQGNSRPGWAQPKLARLFVARAAQFIGTPSALNSTKHFMKKSNLTKFNKTQIIEKN